MAKKTTIEFDVQPGNSAQTIGELRDEYKRLNQEIGNTVAGTDEYYALLGKLGNVKGELKDLKEAIRELDPGDQFKSLAKVGQGLVGGFTAATGAISLFAGKNQELNEALLKVNASLAVLQGVQSVVEGVESAERVFGAWANASKIAAVAQEGLAVANETETATTIEATAATEGLTAALLENPITAVIVAIVAAIAAIAAFTDNTEESERAVKSYNDELDRQNDILNLNISTYGRLIDQQSAAIKLIYAQQIEAARKRNATDSEVAKIEEERDTKLTEAKIGNLETLRNEYDLDYQTKLSILNRFEEKVRNGDIEDDKIAEERSKLRKALDESDQKLKGVTTQITVEGYNRQSDAAIKNADILKKQHDEAQKRAKEEEDRQRKRTALQQEIDKKLAESQAATGQGSKGDVEFAKRQADIQQGRQKDLADLKQSLKEKVISQTQYRDDVQKINTTYDNQDIASRKQHDADLKKEQEEASKKRSDDLIKASQEAYQKQQDQLQQDLVNGNITREQFDKQSLQLKIDNDKALLASDSLTVKDRTDIQRNFNADRLAMLKSNYEEEVRTIKENEQLKADQIKKSYDQQSDAAKRFFDQLGVNVDASAAFQANANVQITQNKINSLQAQRDAAAENGQSTLEFDQQLTEARMNLDDQETKAKMANLDLLANALDGAAELAGKQTAVGKALAIASATIKTYEAATSAYAALAPIPIVGPALGAVAAGLAVAAGIANVKKILSVKVPSKGGDSSGGSSVSGGSSYSAPSVASTGTVTNLSSASASTIASQVNQITNQPVRAYVVESDITSKQERQRTYQNSATL